MHDINNYFAFKKISKSWNSLKSQAILQTFIYTSLDKIIIIGTKKGSKVVDINPVHSMYIYTNIIEHHIVGDTRAPLLRIVNVEGKPGETITKLYDSPHYVPIKQKLIGTVEIDIRDGSGQVIPFVTGTVIVKLHFRKRRSSYF